MHVRFVSLLKTTVTSDYSTFPKFYLKTIINTLGKDKQLIIMNETNLYQMSNPSLN